MTHTLQHLIGKKVKVKFQHIPKNFIDGVGGNTMSGILTFAGFNPFVHDSFQVTIDRVPLWPVNINDVTLFVDTQIKVCS